MSVLDSMPAKRSLSQSDHTSITTVTLESLSTLSGCLIVSALHAWSCKYPAYINARAKTAEYSVLMFYYGSHIAAYNQLALLLLVADSIGKPTFMA